MIEGEGFERLVGEATQAVINERFRGLIEAANKIAAAADKIANDHERRIRFLERTVSYGLGGAGLLALIIRFFEK